VFSMPRMADEAAELIASEGACVLR